MTRHGRTPLHRSRGPAALLALLVALVAARALAAGQAGTWRPVWEHWYVLEIAGAPAGWMRSSALGDGERYRTESEAVFRVSRGPIELEITMSTEFTETKSGRPVELHFVQDMAMQSVDTRWIFGDDGVRIVSKQGGRTIESEKPLPAEQWLTPMAAHKYMVERMKAGAKEITYRTIDGENGLAPTALRFEHQGEERMEFDGRSIPITVWKTTTSAMPGVTATTRLSADGHMVSETVRLPFGEMRTRAVDRAEAIAAGAGPAPELMINTFVPADRPIPRARQTTTSTLRVRVREGDLPPLPSAGAQRVEAGADPKSAVLSVDVADLLPASSEEIDDPAYLEPSAMADASDTLIAKLARRATRDAGDDDFDRAEAMRRFVHRHISAKALDTAFATASETARMRTGDCSEHGVLLCALLRAEDIPARVATGLIYADAFAGEQDIFGWHMWTQALIDGAWVDLDATLDERYDAVHVLAGTSSLADGVPGADLAAMLRLIGNVEIEVVEVGYEEKPRPGTR
jgi:transglutaminase-like putative cysteine protease